MKAWITKYALTSGIQKREIKRSKVEAVKRAEEMRLNKVQSLNKQLKKLGELRFE